MQHHFIKVLILFLVTFSMYELNAQHKPNIVFILADDLGYGEVGIHGQRIIETPNIDALAKNGMTFTQHYTGAPVCAPARCVLLTGKHSGHAVVRGNDEWVERGKVWSLEEMNNYPHLEGQRPIPDSTLTVAEVLQNQGYTTAIFGKWGLGAPYTVSTPNRQGFDYFYGYNCQRQAHTLYPTHLWKNDSIVKLNNRFVNIHQALDPSVDPNNPTSYADYELTDYAPTMIHDEALNWMKSQKQKPFFLYYASPLPHVPLQAPKKWVDYYQKKIGKESPFLQGENGPSYYPNRTPKATYAAMISYLDEQVGEIVKTLKENGQYENTLIIFTSDNGPSYAGGVDPGYFNSAGPFREEYGRGKGFVYEGGIRVPMIATWPKHIKKGSKSNHISAFYDFMPTVCDVIHFPSPSTDGISYLPSLLGKNQIKHDYLYWEFPETGGQQAIRMGQWKAIRQNLHSGNLHIALYDIIKDPLESKDLANKYPNIIAKAKQIFEDNHVPSPIKKFRIQVLGDEN